MTKRVVFDSEGDDCQSPSFRAIFYDGKFDDNRWEKFKKQVDDYITSKEKLTYQCPFCEYSTDTFSTIGWSNYAMKDHLQENHLDEFTSKEKSSS